MRLVTRYLLKAFSRIFFLSLTAFSGIYLLVDFVEHIDNFISRQAEAGDYFAYFFGKMPFIIGQVTPMAVLFGVFMTLGGLSKTNELTALRAGGVSLWRVSAPLLGVGLLATGAVLASNELVVPLTAKEVTTVERTIIRGQPRNLLRRDRVWFREDDRLVNIRLALPAEGILQGITIYRIDRDFQLLERIDADRASYREGAWVFRDLQVRTFDATGLEALGREHIPEKILPLNKTPGDFSTPDFRNDDLTFQELRDLVERLEAEGFDAARYQVDMLARLATPFTSLIMAFLGIPFALQKGRNASLALGVALSVAIGVVFYLIQAMLLAFGYSGVVPPLVAAWAPNLLFILTGIWLLLASRD